MRVDVAGVKITNISRQEAIEEVSKIVRSDKSGYIVTPYSELVVFALKHSAYKNILNNSVLSLPDGIGILWSAKYLSSMKVGLWRSLFAIIFDRAYIRSVIKERISGSEFIYDIAKLAAEKNYSLSLVGGSNNVAAQSAHELKKLFPNLNIKLALSGRPFDEKIVQEINQSDSDILAICYSPPKQEMWLAQNLDKLGVRVAIGLGGTFDYLAKKRLMAPKFMRLAGLEWLWRVITQPWRLARIWNAVPVFIWEIYKYKNNLRNAELDSVSQK